MTGRGESEGMEADSLQVGTCSTATLLKVVDSSESETLGVEGGVRDGKGESGFGFGFLLCPRPPHSIGLSRSGYSIVTLES